LDHDIFEEKIMGAQGGFIWEDVKRHAQVGRIGGWMGMLASLYRLGRSLFVWNHV
jgi:hypothetical protein